MVWTLGQRIVAHDPVPPAPAAPIRVTGRQPSRARRQRQGAFRGTRGRAVGGDRERIGSVSVSGVVLLRAGSWAGIPPAEPELVGPGSGRGIALGRDSLGGCPDATVHGTSDPGAPLGPLGFWDRVVSATRWFTVAAAREVVRVLRAWKCMASGRSGPDSGG
jgi:hypothetical protein